MTAPKPISSRDVCVRPDSNNMEIRALGTEDSILDMSGVRDYLDGERAG